MVDVCPSCSRPRAGSLESVGNSEFCWKTDEYCTQYERDTKPFRDRIRALESELTSARTTIADLSYQLGKAQGEAEGHRLVRVGLEAELAELRKREEDVRALDESGFWELDNLGHHRPDNCKSICYIGCREHSDSLEFTGATPDEARAKAAAWVREQGK